MERGGCHSRVLAKSLVGLEDRSPGEGQGDRLTPGTNVETAAPESRRPSQVGCTRQRNSNWFGSRSPLFLVYLQTRVLVIRSFNKHLLKSYYVPGIVLSAS